MRMEFVIKNIEFTPPKDIKCKKRTMEGVENTNMRCAVLVNVSMRVLLNNIPSH